MHDQKDTLIPRSSLVGEAYVAIRNMIVEGEIPPGSRVTVRPIADRLGLSSTPIKAALVTLEREGMLVSKLHRGYFVPELSFNDMLEIYELRESLDCIASRRVASAPDHAELAETLRRDRREQQRCLERGDLDGYRRGDLEFHRDLWILCGNRRLRRTGDELLGQMKLGNALMARLPGRVSISMTEHHKIIDAIADGDPERAEAVTREHIRSVRDSFVSSNQDRLPANLGGQP
jgi:DNA-binding GntR family transcriptional regulator